MPYVIPNGFEKQWTENFKNSNVLILLLPMIKIWSPEDWLVEKLNDSSARQMSLF